MDALNAWKYANWTGLAIIAGTLLYIGIAARATDWLRKHPRKKTEQMPPCGAKEAVRWAAERRGLLRDHLPHAIDSTNYRVPPHRQHLIDFERSTIILLPDGSVHAQCCVQGCQTTVILGRNVVNATVAPEDKEIPVYAVSTSH